MKKCKCGSPATCKVWEAIFGYAYYCDKCREQQTMEEARRIKEGM